ncbi:MAG: hypothetical protein L0Z53_20500, partial [Acidobacteriales bacterium]|nr:hypothetical protein [Terriglobales bacterium]
MIPGQFRQIGHVFPHGDFSLTPLFGLAGAGLPQMFDVGDCPLVKTQRLLIGVYCSRPVASLSEVGDCFIAQFGVLEMPGQRSGQFAGLFRVKAFKRLGHRQMQMFAILFEQRIVGGVLRQSVAEEVLQIRLRAQQSDQTGGFERVE